MAESRHCSSIALPKTSGFLFIREHVIYDDRVTFLSSKVSCLFMHLMISFPTEVGFRIAILYIIVSKEVLFSRELIELIHYVHTLSIPCFFNSIPWITFNAYSTFAHIFIHCMRFKIVIQRKLKINELFKGLRPVLEGFVVTMHEGACETGSQIPRAIARGIWRTVRTSPSALWQQTPTDRS